MKFLEGRGHWREENFPFTVSFLLANHCQYPFFYPENNAQLKNLGLHNSLKTHTQEPKKWTNPLRNLLFEWEIMG